MISSSTVPIPAIPKFLTNTSATFGDKNAGNVGPKWIFFTPKYNRDSNTITAFCSYHAILNANGNSLISSNSNTSFNFNAIKANEYESLHCPASRTLGIQPMSPNSYLLYLYFAQPAVNITVSFGSALAKSV